MLRKRRGRTLNRRIILKSYLARAADPSLPPGTPEVRQATGEVLSRLLGAVATSGCVVVTAFLYFGLLDHEAALSSPGGAL